MGSCQACSESLNNQQIYLSNELPTAEEIIVHQSVFIADKGVNDSNKQSCKINNESFADKKQQQCEIKINEMSTSQRISHLAEKSSTFTPTTTCRYESKWSDEEYFAAAKLSRFTFEINRTINNLKKAYEVCISLEDLVHPSIRQKIRSDLWRQTYPK